jgi:hypothetical protein
MGLWTGRSLSLPAKWDRGHCVAAIAAALDRPLATVEETEAMFKLAPAGE